MLISFEGIDGSGKTTILEKLQDSYPDIVYTQEPTETWYGDAVRRSLNEQTADPLAELFLYTADHAAHLTDTIKPALSAGEVIISDRYIDSRYAYQSVAINDRFSSPIEYIKEIHAPFTVMPDLTIYFDLDPEIAATRSGVTNKFEQVEFLQSVKRNYERIIAADPDRFVTVDAAQSEDDVYDEVHRILGERITLQE
ncbi:MAG: dTMP kinase [Halobacteriaceae archaeon]